LAGKVNSKGKNRRQDPIKVASRRFLTKNLMILTFNERLTSDSIGGRIACIRQDQPNLNKRRVLLVGHKNKWRDLWLQLVTGLFVVFEGDKKAFLLRDNIFCTNKSVILSPLKKQQQRSDKFLSQTTSLIFVTD
jgi:hypothetical protein